MVNRIQCTIFVLSTSRLDTLKLEDHTELAKPEGCSGWFWIARGARSELRMLGASSGPFVACCSWLSDVRHRVCQTSWGNSPHLDRSCKLQNRQRRVVWRATNLAVVAVPSSEHGLVPPVRRRPREHASILDRSVSRRRVVLPGHAESFPTAASGATDTRNSWLGLPAAVCGCRASGGQ